jgi:F-type H+-transporting ATPase subunit alpha
MTASVGILQPAIERAFARLHQGREDFTAKLTPHEVGIVTKVSTGIATFSGLPSVGYEEIVTFPGGLLGIAFNLDEEEVGVILLGDYQNLHAGDEVQRTGRVMDVPVGDGLLGRLTDPLGNPLDGKGSIAAEKRLPVERPAAPIMDRAALRLPIRVHLRREPVHRGCGQWQE